MRRRITASVLAAILLLAILAGCAEKTEKPAVQSEAQTVSEEAAIVEESATPESEEAPIEEIPEEEAGPIVYDLPLSTDGYSYTLWCEAAPGFMAPYLGADGDFNTAEVSMHVAELTGVDIEYQCIDATAMTERFNLMIASGDYPDLIANLPSRYSGGAEQAFYDEVIIDMKEYIDNDMPAYKKLITDMNIELDLLNDDGQMLGLASITNNSMQSRGPTIRKDWLDELGLEIPETYDELYEVGKAFMTEYDLDGAFYFMQSISPDGTFAAGYDLPAWDITSTGSHFYQKDGQIISAYTQEDFKEYIRLIAKWYQDGLLHPDFYNMAGGDGNNMFVGGKYGLVWDNANFITQNNKNYENFEACGIPLTRREKDQTLHMYSDITSAAINFCISTQCENVETLVKYLDWLYTEEGQLYCNYGMEGKSYFIDDNGKPQWTEEMTTGDAPFQMMIITYVLPGLPSLYDDSRQLSATVDAVGLEAMEMWSNDPNCDGQYAVVVQGTFTDEETTLYNAHISDVETYVATFILGCITGETDIDAEWDSYIDQLYELGLQECIDVKQAVYERGWEKKFGNTDYGSIW